MAELLQVNPLAPEAASIARAAQSVTHGQVVAIPTDTFYGLAANPLDRSAVAKVFAIKERSAAAPLLLLVDSVEMARTLSQNLPSQFFLLVRRFWPGPLTIVVEASPRIPPEVTGNTGRIGLRLPAAAVPVALIRAAGGPLTGTSANRSGEPECSTAQQVEALLGNRVPLILDGGPSAAAGPSTVLDLREESWEILRAGAVPSSEIAAILQQAP